LLQGRTRLAHTAVRANIISNFRDMINCYNDLHSLQTFKTQQTHPSFSCPLDFILSYNSSLIIPYARNVRSSKKVPRTLGQIDCLRVTRLNVKQDRQCTQKRNIEALSCKRCCCLKTIIITYSEWVFLALVIQHAKRMGLIIL